MVRYINRHGFELTNDRGVNRSIRESCDAIDRAQPGSAVMRSDRKAWLEALVDDNMSAGQANRFVDAVFAGCYEIGHARRWVKPKPEPKPEPEVNYSQENAIAEAQNYLQFQAFSKEGLIDQLSSKYGGQFSLADATFAVNHITVSWNDQAVRAAKEYLKNQAFSRQGLIDQLSSEYGGQFSVEQAVYGVNHTGL